MSRTKKLSILRTSTAGCVAMFLLAAGGVVAPKVEATGPLADSVAAEPLRSALESRGVRVSFDGRPLCELWLRKSIPTGRNGSSGALYSALAPSTAVGVIRFERGAADFRGQAISPGLYTLRYAMPPEDGSHLGVSDYPDFLLLLRAADDPNPASTLNREELLDSSRHAAGARHPGVLSLTKPSGSNFPGVFLDEKEHVVLQVRGTLDSGAVLPIALVVRGHAEQ